MAWKRRRAEIRAQRERELQERKSAAEHEQNLVRFRAFLREMITASADPREPSAQVSDELINAIIARADAGSSLSSSEILQFLNRPDQTSQQVAHARFVGRAGTVLALEVHLIEEDQQTHPELWSHYRYVFEDGIRKVEITSSKGRTTRAATVPTGITARA